MLRYLQMSNLVLSKFLLYGSLLITSYFVNHKELVVYLNKCSPYMCIYPLWWTVWPSIIFWSSSYLAQHLVGVVCPKRMKQTILLKQWKNRALVSPYSSPSRVLYQLSFRKGHGPWKWSWYIHIFYYYLSWGRTKWRVVLCPGTNYELPRETELLLFSRPIFRCVSANKEPFVITVVVITSYCRRFYFVRSRIRRGCVHLRNPYLYKSILEKNLQLSNDP